MTSRVETEGQSRAATRSGFQADDRSSCLEGRYDARRSEISVLELGFTLSVQTLTRLVQSHSNTLRIKQIEILRGEEEWTNSFTFTILGMDDNYFNYSRINFSLTKHFS